MKLQPVTQTEPAHKMLYEFSDYDFDDHRSISVYCIITDSRGTVVTSHFAEVLPNA